MYVSDNGSTWARIGASVSALLLVSMLAVGHPAFAQESLDGFNEWSFNSMAPGGQEVPYKPKLSQVLETHEFDTSSYTTQAGEADDYENRSSCPAADGSQASWMGKTGWA